MFNSRTAFNVKGEKINKPNPFAWIEFVDSLANGNLSLHEDIYKMNWIYCVNVLEARKIKAKKEAEEAEQMRKKNTK